MKDYHVMKGWIDLWFCIYGNEQEFCEHYPGKVNRRESKNMMFKFITGQTKSHNMLLPYKKHPYYK
jgi:hypothetical protein